MADSETQQQMTSKTPDTKSHQAADLLLEGVSNALALLGVIGIEDAPNFKKALETKCKTDIMNYMPPWPDISCCKCCAASPVHGKIRNRNTRRLGE